MPTLNWNEIRTRAAAFAKDWANEDSERAEAQSFWNEFFEVFGVKRRRVAVFEKQVVKLPNGGKTAHGRIDVFWPGTLLALKLDGYHGEKLEVFLVRLVFCFFADDTGIFTPKGAFLDLVENRTREDRADVGQTLAKLFEILNTPDATRQKSLDEDLARFPYVNGRLFEKTLSIPDFNSAMRAQLLVCCERANPSAPTVSRHLGEHPALRTDQTIRPA